MGLGNPIVSQNAQTRRCLSDISGPAVSHCIAFLNRSMIAAR